MNLTEALARADALRAEVDRAEREIGDCVSAELDALPVEWSGPIYSVCNMVARERLGRGGLRARLRAWRVVLLCALR